MQKGHAHSPIVGTSAMNTRLKALAILHVGNKISIHTSMDINRAQVTWLQSSVVKSITRHSVFYQKSENYTFQAGLNVIQNSFTVQDAIWLIPGF